jgi:asparagine synthase (glutamine-hydrolysing)
MQTQSKFYLEAFFQTGLSELSDEFFSHLPRWNTTAKIKEFFSSEVKGVLNAYNSVEEMRTTLDIDFSKWDWLSKAQYVEATKLLPGYILSSQGDRMAMANSVEGRFPFLDHRVVEFCCAIPPDFRMKVLKEKYILKKALGKHLPQDIVKRTKQPYMAPDSKSFFDNGTAPDYVEDLLSQRSIKENGYFNPQSVERLVNKCRKNLAIGFKDNMALVGILSMQLLDKLFVKNNKLQGSMNNELKAAG